ncbi:Ig-like domain-containing protein [Arthrobacter sp. TWP1-1]|uniref:Ig-like domain-containing protein n=1 Tax=Arthrobacter sp. TWP1-1 TaxID=2804568 RepID=UPI003CED9BD9
MALSDLFTKSSNKKQLLTASAAMVLSAAVITGAVVYPGFATADVDLNDGSVWVTNRVDGLVGHLNDQSKVLDGGFTATTTTFDVVQNAGHVFMNGDGGSLLNPVNLAMMAMDSETALGGGKQISQGTNIVSLSDSGAGKVWAMANSDVPGFSDKTSIPIVAGLRSAVSVAAPDDTIYTVDAQAGELVTTVMNDAGKVASQERATIEGLAGPGEVQITVAGGKPVIFAPAAGKLFLPGGKSVTVDNAQGGLLAQATGEGDFAALETPTALFTQPLDGSAAKVVELGGTGKAVAPVVQNGCVHAAWSGANKYILACDGSGDLIDIPKAGGNSEFVFRKNRDVVVLNDVNTGNVWLVNQNMLLVNNWDDLKTDLKKADNAEKDSADPNVVNTLPDRTKPNRPPEAVADSFGVRAGRTTILPVLFNDSDPDGDVLTVDPPAVAPELGAVASIYEGTGLQIAVPDTASGAGQFSYTVNDGRGGTSSASVNLKIVPAGENTPPNTMRDSTLVVEQGQTMRQNVLTDWTDPDGDDIYLIGAVSDDKSAVIKSTPDGELSYTDDGENIGMKTMTVSVSDGIDIVEKKIKVNVKTAGSVPPVANADFFKAVVGEPVVLAPLKNDQDPAGGKLRLASVSKLASATVSEIADNGTVTFTSKTEGAVYLEYQVTNGPMSASGLIRINVEAADSQGLPVAVKDLVMLPSGGSALVDVLGNDSDPSGGVLVIQSVELPPGSEVSATIIERNIIKLTDVRGLKDKMSIKYTISNGAGNAVGEISVVRIPAPDKLMPPRVEPDTAVVRVGDVVSIPVLENDTDPNGEVLKSPVVVETPDESLGKLFADQNQLRFIAGPTPKTVQGVYKVANSTGQFNSAQVTITIVAADPEHNLPPAPKNLTGRVIAGDQVRISVPLNGIDPEGDSVELVGVDQGPALGTAETGNGFIYYTAGGSSAGTDSFTYKVRDRLGAEATARVEVGIAPPLAVNHPPVTEDDYITLRPGRNVALDVLLNDSDPDGGQLGLVKEAFQGPVEMAPTVTDKGKLILTSPMEPGIATMLYTVADKFGAQATGNVRMTVTPDAALKAPIARDDRVTVKQMLGKNTVDVPVLDNDADPDGVTEDLTVSIEAVAGKNSESASVSAGGAVRIVLAPQEQMIPYTVTDQDGLTSTAVIWVPGQDKQYPVLKSTEVIRMTAGESAVMKLSDYVQVREGRTPRLTEASKISFVGAGKDDVIVGDGAGVNYASDIKFYGPGSITFEVTDGTGPDDPAGLKSTLTVMTLVDPAPVAKKEEEDKPEEEVKKNTPPTFTGSSLDVAQQEKATVDVGPMAFDIDPGDKEKFKYAMVGNQPGNFEVSFSGTVLTAKQRDGTKVGEQATVQLSVSDGTNEPVIAEVILRATSTSLPQPVANEDVVLEAHAGRSEVVKVLANDVNPFPDTPLTVVDTMTETGSAGITVAHTADSVTVNSNDDYKGTVVVRYTVEDKTKDENRHATGRIRIVIKGKPDAPTKPQVVEEKDHAVLLKWDPPADNGSPITKYTVSWTGGTQDCSTNTCTITGLKNGTEYKFSVTASNAVATSAASPVSAAAMPDRMPDAPAAPTTTFGDKSVTVRWVTPVGEFTPVTKFNVEISPAPAGQNGQKPEVTGNSLIWPGLENGTEYQFRVQAINKAPKPSEWSAYSASVVPAGEPSAPAAPTVQVLAQVGSQNQIGVQWNVPYNNGATVTKYTLTQSGGGEAARSYTPTTNSQTVTVNNSTEPYTFSVTATNKAGTGASSPASSPQRAVGKVDTMSPPTIQIADQNGAGGFVVVTYSPLNSTQLRGYAANEATYCVTLSTGGGEQCGVPSGVKLASPNGAAVYATVRARASAGSQSSVGDSSGPSPIVKPYGVPGQTSVTGSTASQGVKKVSWTWTAANNNGSAITRYESSLNGAGWVDRGGALSYTTNTGSYNEEVTLGVRACNIGGCGAAFTATSTSGAEPDPPPPPPVTKVRVLYGTFHSCTQGPGEGGNFYRAPNGKLYCGTTESPGGDVDLGGKWLDRADGWVTVSGCASGSHSDWYVMSDGPQAGRWVRGGTSKENTVEREVSRGAGISC